MLDTARLRTPRAVASSLAGLAVGVLCLAATARRSFLELSWSDEIVYAVVGRNIAAGRGPITNFYESRALLQGGYPQGDVHMPGHALLMSPFFRLLGHADWVAIAPSWAAFLATCAIVSALAGRAFGGAAGVLAAALFCLMPGTAGYAHSAMSELTVALASAAFLLAWWEVRTPRRAAWLALALGAAVLCRETLLAFLVLAAEALWRAPRACRVRAVLAFLAVLALCLLVVVPAWQERARFPHFLSSLPAPFAPGWSRTVQDRVRDNLALPLPPRALTDWLFYGQLALGTVLPAAVVLFRKRPETTRLAWAVLALTSINVAGLAGFYPLKSWAAVRVFLFLSPWAAVLVAGVACGAGRAWRRWLAAAAAVAALGVPALRTVEALAEDRRVEQARNGEVAALFMRLTRGLQVEVLVPQESPWEIGWRCYPIKIVWNVRLEPESLRRVSQVLRVDAVLGKTRVLLPLAEAAGRGELGEPYVLVRRNAEARRQLLVRSALRSQLP